MINKSVGSGDYIGEKMKYDELEPVDASRCQAEVKSGSFMTLGPRCLVRCENVPVWIGVEIRNGEFYGVMSLCDKCKKVCEIQMPDVKFQKLFDQPLKDDARNRRD